MELTARKTKIKSLSKQSKFEGSDRQVRWRIMKQLTKPSITNNQLLITVVQEEFPWKKVKEIIKPMEKEWLIHIKKWILYIAN
jgi:endonuclease V-like protein UPF0215 family